MAVAVGVRSPRCSLLVGCDSDSDSGSERWCDSGSSVQSDSLLEDRDDSNTSIVVRDVDADVEGILLGVANGLAGVSVSGAQGGDSEGSDGYASVSIGDSCDLSIATVSTEASGGSSGGVGRRLNNTKIWSNVKGSRTLVNQKNHKTGSTSGGSKPSSSSGHRGSASKINTNAKTPPLLVSNYMRSEASIATNTRLQHKTNSDSKSQSKHWK